MLSHTVASIALFILVSPITIPTILSRKAKSRKVSESLYGFVVTNHSKKYYASCARMYVAIFIKQKSP